MSDITTKPDQLRQLGAGILAAANTYGYDLSKPLINLIYGPGSWERTVASGDQKVNTPLFGPQRPSDIGNIAGLGLSLLTKGGAVTKMLEGGAGLGKSSPGDLTI